MIKKKIKRITSVVLGFLMITSLAMPSFAAESTEVTTVLATVTINGTTTEYSSLVDAIQYAQDNSSESVEALVVIKDNVINCPTINISSGNINLDLTYKSVYFNENINGINLTGGTLTLNLAGGTLYGKNNETDNGKYYSVVNNNGGTFNNHASVISAGTKEGPAVNNISGTSNLYNTVYNNSNSAVYVSSGECNIYNGYYSSEGCKYVVEKSDSSSSKLNIIPKENQVAEIKYLSSTGSDTNIPAALAYNANIGGKGLVKLDCSCVNCDYGVSNCSFNPSCNVEIMVERATNSKGTMTSDCIDKIGSPNNIYVGNNLSNIEIVDSLTSDTLQKKCMVITTNPIYNINYELDGGYDRYSNDDMVTKYIATCKTDLPPLIEMKKSGYTFNNWYDNPDCSGSTVCSVNSTVTGDKTFYAKWKENAHHTITFDTTGGSFVDGYTAPTEYVEDVGLTLPVEKNIVKEGYVFEGWYTTSDLAGPQVKEITNEDTEDKIYYAKWVSENSILGKHYSTNQVFDCQRHMETGDDNVNYQYCTEFLNPYVAYESTDSIGDVSVDDIDGYESNDGWYYKFDNDGTNADCPITLNLYNKDGELVKLISDAGNIESYGQGCFMYVASKERTDGTELSNKYGYFITSLRNNYHIYGSCDGDEDCDDLDSYVRAGCGEKFAIQYNDLSKELIESIVMDKINLTFSYNGQTYTKEEVKDQLIAFPPVQFTAPEHYEFSGWNSKADGSGQMYGESATFSEDTTLYATYKLRINSITFKLNNGTFTDDYSAPTEYTEGIELSLPTAENMKNDGYTFDGWFENNDLSGDKITSISITDTGDKTYFAKWVKNAIIRNITYYLNDGDFSSGYSVPTQYTEGTELSLPTAANMENDGYDFDGWFENNDFSGEVVTSITDTSTGDKAYYAKWIKTFVKPTFERTDNSVALSDTSGKATTVGYAYIGSTDPVVDSWTSFVQVGSAFTNVNGKNGYIKKISPENGYAFTLNKAGYYIAYVKYNDESGREKIDYSTYKLDGIEPLYSTITLNKKDGVFVSDYSEPTQYEEGTTLTLPTSKNIKKDGYTFGGWYENDDFSGDAVKVITSKDSGNKTYYAKWTESVPFVKPTFTRASNKITLSDEIGKASTIAYEYIGTSDLGINSWTSFVSSGLSHTDINGKTGYTKKITPANGYPIVFNTVGFYTAFIKYTNEDGVETIDYYTYQVKNDSTTPVNQLPMFTEDGNNKILVSNGYKIISVGYSYTGHTPHAFEGWNDFINYGKKYTYSNSSLGYNKVLSPVDGATISLVNGGYYTCFIKYYDKDNSVKYVGATYQVGDKTPYFIMNSNGGAEIYNNNFEIVSTGYIYCPDGTDIASCKTWNGFLEAGQQCAMNTDSKYSHDNYSNVTYTQNLGYRKIYDPNNEAILYFDAADNGYTGGSYVSFIKYKDGDKIKYVWEDYNIIG